MRLNLGARTQYNNLGRILVLFRYDFLYTDNLSFGPQDVTPDHLGRLRVALQVFRGADEHDRVRPERTQVRRLAVEDVVRLGPQPNQPVFAGP